MKILVFTASPNTDGLTAACGGSACKGAKKAGADVELINLNQINIQLCQACGRGYGSCWSEHVCSLEDDFSIYHQKILQVDGFVLISPVYWGEMSESAKAFFDRIRRCEGTKWEKSGLKDKRAVGIAAAGGSGRGTISCLFSMQQLFAHLRLEEFDLISITQKTRTYKLGTIYDCLYEAVSWKENDG